MSTANRTIPVIDAVDPAAERPSGRAAERAVAYPRLMCDGTSPPQVWHRYRMGHLINVVWFDHRLNTAQMLALDDAWDTLVVRDEWRDWVRRIPRAG